MRIEGLNRTPPTVSLRAFELRKTFQLPSSERHNRARLGDLTARTVEKAGLEASLGASNHSLRIEATMRSADLLDTPELNYEQWRDLLRPNWGLYTPAAASA
jgi:hypothetical protein